MTDSRVVALLAALCRFRVTDRFLNRDLGPSVAQLLGLPVEEYRPNEMTYDLRRLRLHELIERMPRTRRYRLTAEGVRIAYFATRVHTRLFRTGLSSLLDASTKPHGRSIAAALRRIEKSTGQL